MPNTKPTATFTSPVKNTTYNVVFFAIPLIDYKAEAISKVCKKGDSDIVELLGACLNRGVDDFFDQLSNGMSQNGGGK